MEKVILKLKPSNYWRIGEHESWFSDMANEGLHLRKMGKVFAHFIKEEPKKTRYRIDVLHNKTITSEQLEMYAESGWSYVTSYGMFNVFSSPDELNAPELHTDPEEQSHTLKELYKSVFRSALWVGIISLVLLGLIILSLFTCSTPTILLVEGETIQSMIIFVLFTTTAYKTIEAAVAVRSLRKKLKEGKPINHSAPWRVMRNVDLFLSIVIILFAIVITFLLIFQIVKSEMGALNNGITGLPIVRLADIEQNPDLVQKKACDQCDVDRGNRYSYEWSILAPIHYETNEHGIISGQQWNDGSGEYSPSIHNSVYKVHFPSMNENLIDDLIKRHSSWDPEREFVQIEHNDFDILIVQEDEELKEIFAARGKGVIYVRYHGSADIDRLIANAAHQISLIAR